ASKGLRKPAVEDVVSPGVPESDTVVHNFIVEVKLALTVLYLFHLANVRRCGRQLNPLVDLGNVSPPLLVNLRLVADHVQAAVDENQRIGIVDVLLNVLLGFFLDLQPRHLTPHPLPVRWYGLPELVLWDDRNYPPPLSRLLLGGDVDTVEAGSCKEDVYMDKVVPRRFLNGLDVNTVFLGNDGCGPDVSKVVPLVR